MNACPTDISQKVKASKRLGCGYDKFNNSQYLCLPNVKKTSLVEFCHNGVMGYQEKGICSTLALANPSACIEYDKYIINAAIS